MRFAGSASLQECKKKNGHEFGGLASIVVDMDRANVSLAVLGLGFVPRFAS